MQIFIFTISRDRHTASEEGDVPQEGEADGETAVCAENPNGWEGTDDAYPEGYHVGQRGDCDANSGLRHHVPHALGNGQLHGCTPPSRQHYKCVINADTCGIEN